MKKIGFHLLSLLGLIALSIVGLNAFSILNTLNAQQVPNAAVTTTAHVPKFVWWDGVETVPQTQQDCLNFGYYWLIDLSGQPTPSSVDGCNSPACMNAGCTASIETVACSHTVFVDGADSSTSNWKTSNTINVSDEMEYG